MYISCKHNGQDSKEMKNDACFSYSVYMICRRMYNNDGSRIVGNDSIPK